MNEMLKTIITAYNALAFDLVLSLRGAGLHFMSVNIINGVLLLIALIIAYKLFGLAKKAVIYMILLVLVTLPFIFLLISSYFYGGTTLNDIVK